METQIPHFKTTKEVKEAILKDQRHLERALVAIYELNTIEERTKKKAIGRDGKGFSKYHMKICCYMAQYVQRRVKVFGHSYGNNLNDTWLEKAKKIVPKYSEQLLKLNQKKVKQLANV
jgi:hypothetical protein